LSCLGAFWSVAYADSSATRISLALKSKLASSRQFSKSLVDKYFVKAALTMEDIVKLMEVGFEIVTEFEGKSY
jgi:hypothetical protein